MHLHELYWLFRQAVAKGLGKPDSYVAIQINDKQVCESVIKCGVISAYMCVREGMCGVCMPVFRQIMFQCDTYIHMNMHRIHTHTHTHTHTQNISQLHV